MPRLPAALLLLVAVAPACTGDATPAFAFDPIFLEPVGAGVHGFETWQLYSSRWSKHQNDRYYVCSVVTEFSGTPGTACPDCTEAWTLTDVAVIQTDCGGEFGTDPMFTTLRALGLGGPAKGDVPYPGQTTEAFADWGNDWEAYGDGWPEALDAGDAPTDATWDGVQAFNLLPNATFAVDGGSAAIAPVTTASRSR